MLLCKDYGAEVVSAPPATEGGLLVSTPGLTGYLARVLALRRENLLTCLSRPDYIIAWPHHMRAEQ
jgi:hypothetical protein